MAILKSVFKETFIKKVIFQLRLKRGEGVSHVDFWGKKFAGKILASKQSRGKHIWAGEMVLVAESEEPCRPF